MNDPNLSPGWGGTCVEPQESGGPRSLLEWRLWAPRAGRGKFVSDRGRNWLCWVSDVHLFHCTYTTNLAVGLALGDDGKVQDSSGSPFPSQSPQPPWGRRRTCQSASG